MKQIKFAYKKTCLVDDNEIENIKSNIKLDYSGHAFGKIIFDKQCLENVKQVVARKQQLNPTTLVVIGIGGSNLGTWAVYDTLRYTRLRLKASPGTQGERIDIHPVRGEFLRSKSIEPYERAKIYFADTIDSEYIESILQIIEQELKQNKNIIINVVSKSGTTLETNAILQVFLELIRKYKQDNFEDYIVVTSDAHSPLHKFAEEINCDFLEIPKDLGGRYSVFSAVGLFPLAMLGVNIEELLDGARSCNLEDAKISAAILYKHYKAGVNIHDTFLFAVCLEMLGKWYRQLMAESLGKSLDMPSATRDERGVGMTPTVSIGTTDLHSMLQLTLGGPNDKFTTFVIHDNSGQFKKLMNAIIAGTKIAYKKNSRAFCEINLHNKSEYYIGQFMQFKMYEIVFFAELLKVNAFDQSNVEDYKLALRQAQGERGKLLS